MKFTMTPVAAPCPSYGMPFGLPTLAGWQGHVADRRDQAAYRQSQAVSHPSYNSISATLRSNVLATLGVTSVNPGRVRNGAAKQAAPPRGEPR